MSETVRADSDLKDLWRIYARRMTDTALAACVAVSISLFAGFAVVALMHAHWAQRWWPLALPTILVGSFGAWGIADRELAERRRRGATSSNGIRALVAVEWASCVAAGLAGAAAVIVFLRLTVGTWIS
jgi:hypothetical protein